jgi:curved DNA-binding protein CbpA
MEGHMNGKDFVDYYELLQLSPNAYTDAIERMFRHHAKKYHPDNTEYADSERFQKIVEAHRILTDPESRAAYDIKYQDYWNHKWRLAAEASNKSAFGDDQITREQLLSLLYVQRRRNMRNPGLGEYEMARLLCTPPELVEFHVWYLRAKDWVERLQSGQLAITAAGVDEVEKGQLRLNPDHLIGAREPAGKDGEKGEDDDKNLLLSDV